ncbi:hypothetical protein B296_00026512, partial [Ensete ventricosum]
AKLRATKLAEEAERAALEAAQRAAEEAAESKAAASEDAKKKSMDHDEEERKERGSFSKVPKEVQLTTGNQIFHYLFIESSLRFAILVCTIVPINSWYGCPMPKVLAADAALRAEASRQKIYNEVADKSNLIACKINSYSYGQEFDRCGRQIYKNLKQIAGTVENVR